MLHQVQTWHTLCTEACRKRIMCTIMRVTVFLSAENGNIANRIHRFTIDYGKLILMADSIQVAQPIRLQHLH